MAEVMVQNFRDAPSGMTVPKLRDPTALPTAGQYLDNSPLDELGIGTHNGIGAFLYRDRPLGVLP